jgi:hypothetical protein
VFQTYIASVSIVLDLCLFYQDVAKVDLGVAHIAVGPILQQPPAIIVEPACMRVGVERAPRCRRGTRSGMGHSAVRDMKWRGPRCGRGTRSGTGPHMKQAKQARASGR